MEKRAADQINAADVAAIKMLASESNLSIDVGTFIGGSAEAMLQASSGRVITIDTFQGSDDRFTGGYNRGELVGYTVNRLAPYADRFSLIVGRSLEIAALLPDKIADLVFLDAAHDYASVMADISAWWPKVRPGGVLAGHDFDRIAMNFDEAFCRERCHHDTDPETNIHFGVLCAVIDSFDDVSVCGEGDQCTVWFTRK